MELLPGGRESGRRVLATAKIGRVESGTAADYRVELQEDALGDIGAATLRTYPRLSSTIWDLVARAIAVALTGREELPPRPQPLNVPIHHAGRTSYVRLREIPEPAASLFRKRIEFSTRPLIEEDPQPMDCAYSWDWLDFLAGRK
ncbi:MULTISPECIES: hypothetical protein [Paraburkholderia]|uniref:hypothetical protein n=1 Tax=Paraburkholderia TaxID=1822464 RepID=UPI0028AFAF57|nr:hypothetical protein [Paraburkholderia podalyriae]